MNKNIENTGLSVALLCIIRIIPNLKKRGVIMDKVSVFEIFMVQCNYMHEAEVPNINVDGKKYLKQLCMHKRGPVKCHNAKCPVFPVVGESL